MNGEEKRYQFVKNKAATSPRGVQRSGQCAGQREKKEVIRDDPTLSQCGDGVGQERAAQPKQRTERHQSEQRVQNNSRYARGWIGIYAETQRHSQPSNQRQHGKAQPFAATLPRMAALFRAS